MHEIDRAFGALESWAKDGEDRAFVIAPPKDDAGALVPQHGTLPAWSIPPSLAYALTRCSFAQVSWGPSTGHEEFLLLDPEGMAEYNEILYLPGGIARGADGPELSTNHLVPFASGGDEESAFCFDVTHPRDDGEYPVYYSHQDHPRFRVAATGEWEDPEDVTPDFHGFAAWLTWVADTLTAGGEPECSYPTAFYNMPGRSG